MSCGNAIDSINNDSSNLIALFLSFYSGCLTQLMGGIDSDWASFSEAIERLMTFVRNKDGIESVIKNLDGKLSEAIMHAMTNGPDLQKKVSRTESLFFTFCGDEIYGDFRLYWFSIYNKFIFILRRASLPTFSRVFLRV